MKLGLLNPPRLRVAEGANEERHATWLELFYDLIFVAAIAQLSSNLTADYTPSGVARAAILFVPIWWAWVGHTFFSTRFDTDDLAHRLLTMAQMGLVASMGIHIPRAFSDSTSGFPLSYAGVRLILVIQYLRAGTHVPIARALTSRYALGFAIALLPWILSTFVPTPYRYGLWGLGILIDFLTPMTAGTLHIKFPPHLMHLPERFGLFTIIVLGEAVVATVQGTGKTALHPAAVSAGFLGLVAAFTLWWGYFDGVKAAEVRQLKTRSQVRRYQTWLYSHLPLTFGITVAAAGVKLMLLLPVNIRLQAAQGWIYCVAIGLCMTCLNAIFLSSPFAEQCPKLAWRRISPNILIGILALSCGLFAPAVSPVVLVGAISAFCVLQIMLSLRYEGPGAAANSPDCA